MNDTDHINYIIRIIHNTDYVRGLFQNTCMRDSRVHCHCRYTADLPVSSSVISTFDWLIDLLTDTDRYEPWDGHDTP